MAYKKRDFAVKPIGRPMCLRISCTKPAAFASGLCVRHEAEREMMDGRYGHGHYSTQCCLSDKCKETVVDKGAKKKAKSFPRHDRDED